MRKIPPELIKTRRKEFGYTQDSLAVKIGVTHVCVLRWEKGLASPRIPTQKIICQILRLDFDTLQPIPQEIEKKHEIF